PFTVLYLVHIVLAAVVLNARWTAWVSTLAVGCFAALFLVPRQACCGLGNAGVESAYLTHMQGMWFAFAAAALLISYFVRQLTLAAERQREQIVLLQAQAQHAAHMASLTTLAAGTAHELRDRKSTRLNSSHVKISYAVVCLKKKNSELGRDAAGRMHLGQGLQGGAHGGVGVARTGGLGQHVLHAHRLVMGAHGAAGVHDGAR